MTSQISGRPAFSITDMVHIALMTAVICILGPLSVPIPVSPVPLSLTNLAIFLVSCLLGRKAGTISYLLYLIIGIAGVPVFSGFSAGLGKLAGPTGGYLVGMIFTAMICGAVFEHSGQPVSGRPWAKSPVPARSSQENLSLIRLVPAALGLMLGTAVSYLFGTLWLCFVAHLTWKQGLWAGVIPYIPGDLVKIILAVIIGPKIKARLLAAGLLADKQD